jgi:hypothetical protein
MKSNNAGVVELIDRALNKGVILNADLVVTVADIPLLAVNLKLALVSVETMLKYGMMEDWLKPLSLDEKKMTPVKDHMRLVRPNGKQSNISSPHF